MCSKNLFCYIEGIESWNNGQILGFWKKISVLNPTLTRENSKRSSSKEFLLVNFRFEAEGAEQKPVDVKIVNFVHATFAHAVTDVLILMQSATEAQVV